MCGILTVISKNKIKLNQEEIVSMRDKMIHRGPDDAGVYLRDDGELALAHRRLSILDLSSNAHQPMKSNEGNYLVFNGEIYNYKELKENYLGQISKELRSDTEVLINLLDTYKAECLNNLNGMWSFVYYDANENKLIVSRDRFGVKPLYYYEDDKVLILSSEIKPILESRFYTKKLNKEAARVFLETGIVDGIEETFFQGINRFPSSCYMIYDLNNNQREVKRYYDIKESIYEVSDDYDENVKKFRELFIDSVRLRLRSDVPVGNCLSGGLDSSSIYAIAKQLSNGETHSFSSKYEEEECDESYFYKAVIDKYPGINHEVISPYENLEEKLKKIIYYLEEPCKAYGVFSMWHVIEEASSYVKVLLDGQGGDEVLAGYDYYLWYHIIDILENGADDTELERELSYIEDKKDFRFVQSMPNQIRELLSSNIEKFNNSYLNGQLFNDLTSYMIPAFLRYEDKIGMAFSIEARFPFLDYRLINFLFSLCSSHKINKGWSKAILRDAMNGILPDEVCWRKDKKGYPTPLNNLLALNPSMTKYIPNDIEDNEWYKWRFISFNMWREVYGI